MNDNMIPINHDEINMMRNSPLNHQRNSPLPTIPSSDNISSSSDTKKCKKESKKKRLLKQRKKHAQDKNDINQRRPFASNKHIVTIHPDSTLANIPLHYSYLLYPNLHSIHDADSVKNSNLCKIENRDQVQQHNCIDNRYIEMEKVQYVHLPKNQYECTLRRRAIRKETYSKRIKNVITHDTHESSAINNHLDSSNTSIENHTINSQNYPQHEQYTHETFHSIDSIDEIEGDISLGMTLTILSGKVIVQSVIPLKDGRASPAQLCGLISRGDVLISVEGHSLLVFGNPSTSSSVSKTSLVGSSSSSLITNSSSMSLLKGNNALSGLELLVERLKPLSECDENGTYPRMLRLRFLVGAGLCDLEQDSNNSHVDDVNVKVDNVSSSYGDENPKLSKTDPIKFDDSTSIRGNGTHKVMDGAIDLFNLSKYTYVDQLSGLPLFSDNDLIENNPPPEKISNGVKPSFDSSIIKDESIQLKTDETLTTTTTTHFSEKSTNIQNTQALSINHCISIQMELESKFEKKKHTSSYYLLDDRFSSILRADKVADCEAEMKQQQLEIKDDTAPPRNKEYMIRLGENAILGAKLLFNELERGTKWNESKKVDPLDIVRSECRSLSSRSRFSRKTNLTLVPPSIPDIDEDSDDNDQNSLESSKHADFPCMDEGDEMLLKLAAYNNVWKKQMIESLAAEAIINFQDEKMNSNESVSLDEKTEDQLQKIFFGDQVSEIMNKRQTIALPPDEMTAVLYDIANRVSSILPSSIHVLDLTENPTSVQLRSTKPRKEDPEITEATRFLVDDILPLWLNTFRPLPLSERRVIWPLEVEKANGSISIASLMSANTAEKKKQLEDQIVGIELHTERMSETCYLVTYYFHEKIISLIKEQIETGDSVLDCEQLGVQFIEKFGSYLNLHQSVLYASENHMETILQSLLHMVAEYDPSHIESMKLITRKDHPITYYDAKYLSCLLYQLPSIIKGGTNQDYMISLLVMAYPDIKPYRVRKAATSINLKSFDSSIIDLNNDHHKVYYKYLSLLMEKNDTARYDKDLIEEWCTLSISTQSRWDQTVRLENFMKVARPPSSKNNSGSSKGYSREIPKLIDFSMEIKDYNLCLSLVDELVGNPIYMSNYEMLTGVVNHLRDIALVSITRNDNVMDESNCSINEPLFRQYLLVMNKLMYTHPSSPTVKKSIIEDMVSISQELLQLLQEVRKQETSGGGDDTASSNDDNFNNETLSPTEKNLLKVITELARPKDILLVLSEWEMTNYIESDYLLRSLKKCLIEEAKVDMKHKVSGSLMVLDFIRSKGTTTIWSDMNESNMVPHYNGGISGNRSRFINKQSVWNQVLKGAAKIDK